jgi:pimeloyl-ACP methyl ester carboxylesterase
MGRCWKTPRTCVIRRLCQSSDRQPRSPKARAAGPLRAFFMGGFTMRLILRLITGLVVIAFIALAGLRGIAAFRETVALADSIPAEGRRITTDAGVFYIEEAGPATGTPVLLIHGSVGWSHLWADTMVALTDAGYHSIAIDLPPMGYSDRDPAGDYSRQRQAARILAITKALNIKPIVIAHSFGAGPAAEAVLLSPDAFSGLVLVDAAIGLGSDGAGKALPWPLRPTVVREWLMSATATNLWATRPLIGMFLYRKAALTDDQIAILQRPANLQGSTAALATWLPSLMLPPVDALSTTPGSYASLTLPTALIWGDRDTTTPLAQADALQRAIPGATLAILPDVGHIPQIEDPEAFRATLIGVLASLTARQ